MAWHMLQGIQIYENMIMNKTALQYKCSSQNSAFFMYLYKKVLRKQIILVDFVRACFLEIKQ